MGTESFQEKIQAGLSETKRILSTKEGKILAASLITVILGIYNICQELGEESPESHRIFLNLVAALLAATTAFATFEKIPSKKE